MKLSFTILATACLALSSSPAAETSTASDNNAGTNTGGSATKAKSDLLHAPTYDECMASGNPVVTRKEIYHDGWTDLNKNGKKDVYEDSTAPVEMRLDDLISQMNVNEKTAQMATLYGYNRVAKDYLPTHKWFKEVWKDGVANIDEHLNGYPYADTDLPGVEFLWPASKHTWALNEVQRFFIEETRLGVPAEFTDEGLRGVEHFKATCFPTQLALGQTWNRKLLGRIAGVAAREAKALGYDNIYSPIMDVMRDPRWGRCEESYGESPYLVGEMGVQVVKAIQAEGVVSTAKHFCIYANNKGAREGYARTDPRISLREAEMLHIWPFEHVMREAGPLGVMASYNDYDGVPIQGSHSFLTELLRDRLGFKGYVVSDSDAVEYINKKHMVAKDYKEGVRQAVMAGLNVRTTFTPPHVFLNPLRELVNEGSIPMEVIDSRVRDVLRVKMWEGLFDQPYRPLDKVDEIVLNPAHLAISREASRECLVLLKNENKLLPLDDSKMKTIAVCGPNADNPTYALGRYGPGHADIITVRKALETRFAGNAEILYSQGADFFDSRWPDTEIMWEPPIPAEQKLIDAAVADAEKADIAIVVVGDQPRGIPDVRSSVGENSSRTGISLTGYQDDLIRAVQAVGKPTIIVHISGRPNALNWANRLCPAILQAFFPGMDGGTAIVDTLFGDYNPGGKLTCTFPKTSGQIELNFPTKPSANAEQDKDDKVSVTGVLWPFGHGLSYTSFKYSDLKISPQEQTEGGKITVSFKLTNTGDREGDEVPLLFVHDEVSSVTTWEKRLCGFDRIHLEKGGSKDLNFTILPESLTLWNRDMKRVVEPGTFKVMVGSSSVKTELEGKFEITEPTTAQVTPRQNDEEKPLVICFGDSITKRGYPVLLAKNLGVKAINAGVAGNSSAAGLRRMKKDVLEKNPDVVVLFFGTNDARVDAERVFVSAQDYQKNLERMVEECEDTGSKVVICTLPPIDEKAYFTRHESILYDEAGGTTKIWEGYRTAATAVAEKHKLPLVDLNEKLRDQDWLTKDGVHPSEKGCRIIADMISESVQPLILKP